MKRLRAQWALFLGLLLPLISIARADDELQAHIEPDMDAADSLLQSSSPREKDCLKVYERLQHLFHSSSDDEEDIFHLTVLSSKQSSQGLQKAARKEVLVRMKALLQKSEALFQTKNEEAEAFVSNGVVADLKNKKHVLNPESIYEFLPTDAGFTWIRKVAQALEHERRYLEAEIILLDAKDYSLGYEHLSPQDRLEFLSELGSLSVNLGLQERVQSLTREMREFKLLEAKGNVGIARSVDLHIEELQKQNEDINGHADERHLLRRSQSPTDSLAKMDLKFLSPTLIDEELDRAYVLGSPIGSDDRKNEVFLYTENLNNGEITRQFVEYAEVSSSTLSVLIKNILPYQLRLRNERLYLTGRQGIYEFNLLGQLESETRGWIYEDLIRDLIVGSFHFFKFNANEEESARKKWEERFLEAIQNPLFLEELAACAFSLQSDAFDAITIELSQDHRFEVYDFFIYALAYNSDFKIRRRAAENLILFPLSYFNTQDELSLFLQALRDQMILDWYSTSDLWRNLGAGGGAFNFPLVNRPEIKKALVEKLDYIQNVFANQDTSTVAIFENGSVHFVKASSIAPGLDALLTRIVELLCATRDFNLISKAMELIQGRSPEMQKDFFIGLMAHAAQFSSEDWALMLKVYHDSGLELYDAVQIQDYLQDTLDWSNELTESTLKKIGFEFDSRRPRKHRLKEISGSKMSGG